MEVIVLNLEKDVVKKEHMKSQLNKLDVSYVLFQATLGKSVLPERLDIIYNDYKSRRNLCRSLVSSEIGIALSHIHIYEYIVDNKLPYACILEDDVVLPSAFPELLKAIEESIDEQLPQVVLLSSAYSNAKKVKSLTNGYSLQSFKSGYYTSSYIINYLGAKSLARELYPIGNVADCWNKLARHKIIDIKVVKPTLVEQDQATFRSSTTAELKDSKVVHNRMRYLMCRLSSVLIDRISGAFNAYIRPYKNT